MRSLRIIPVIMLLGLMTACSSSSPLGKKVKEPFTGSKYESTNRFFRATGKGVSIKDNIAKSKADIDAKNQLAGQVSTTMKNVSDQYLSQTDNANAAVVADRFESLTRQVMSTNLADLRKIGEEKYFDGNNYSVFIAYEIKKAAMFRFMKKQAKTDKKVDAQTLKTMEEILDLQIQAAESGE